MVELRVNTVFMPSAPSRKKAHRNEAKFVFSWIGGWSCAGV